jgi:hypothetical protein
MNLLQGAIIIITIIGIIIIDNRSYRALKAKLE